MRGDVHNRTRASRRLPLHGSVGPSRGCRPVSAVVNRAAVAAALSSAADGYVPWCAKTRAARLRGVTIIELEHAAEALAALDRAQSRGRCRGRDALVVQPLVRPFFVIVSHERADGCSEMRLAEWHIQSKYSDLTDKTNRSANAFKFGLRAGSRSGFTPLFRSRHRNAASRADLGPE